MEPQTATVESTFDQIFDRAMRAQQQIQHIVIGSEQGLVIAFRTRSRGKDARLAALAPVLADAGETVFNEVGLSPLGEVLLVGAEGTVFQARLKEFPAFLVIAARGQVNVGLLRMVAAEIEAEAADVLRSVLR